MMEDPAKTFMHLLITYYGNYRSKGTRVVVEKWLTGRIRENEVLPLFEKCMLEISGQYGNTPDIAQLFPLIEEVRKARPPMKQIVDPNVIPKDEGARRLASIKESLIKKKSLRRQREEKNDRQRP